jgi:hypothetical protein
MTLGSTPHCTSCTSGKIPGVQESLTTPLTHEVAPSDAHAPVPQEVITEAYSSSVKPSQSSSIPSHVRSFAAGVPGVHESWTDPLTHEVTPDA